MRYVAMKVVAVTSLSMIGLLNSAFAQQPPAGMAAGAFAEILAAADKNKDGKLSLEECYAIWKNRATAEKQCQFWDSNNDGVITEEEYVAQAGSLMK
jgi:Ca2+-binding EF-hand superfamily protein